MKSGKTTNMLLALIVLLLLGNILLPMLKAKDAAAVGEDAVSPAVAAAEIAESLALDKVAAQIADALREIAQSNQQIALAIKEHARSNERIAYSLDKLTVEMRPEQ